MWKLWRGKYTHTLDAASYLALYAPLFSSHLGETVRHSRRAEAMERFTLFGLSPTSIGLRDDMIPLLNSALKKMRNLLACEMINPISSTPYVPESSAGVTDVHAVQTHYINKYHKDLNAQREFDSLSAGIPWRPSRCAQSFVQVHENRRPFK